MFLIDDAFFSQHDGRLVVIPFSALVLPLL